MKQELQTRFFFVFLISCFAFFLPTSCSRVDSALEEISSKTPGFELSAVRSGYDRLIESDVSSKKKKGKSEKVKKKKVNWDNSYTFKIDGEDKLIVPFSLDEDFYYMNPDSTTSSFSENTFFVVSKKGNSYDYEVVTRYPEMKWLNRKKRIAYSGTVLVEDVNGNFLKGYKYDDGKVTHEIFEQQETGRTNYTECFQISYYSCSYVPEIGWYSDCIWMYNDFKCYTSVHGGSSGGGYAQVTGGGYNYGGGGGGGSSANGRPYIGEYPDYLRDIVKNKFLIALNAAQKFLVNEIIFFYLKNCFNNVVYANICASGLRFEFKMDPSLPGQGGFDPFTDEFKFKEDDAIKSDVFTEEIFHGFQKTYYPGGTQQYIQSASNPNPPAGRVNMEFEAWLMRDIEGMLGDPTSTGCCRATNDPQYFPWLLTITDNGTKWPEWSDMQGQYYNFMDKFRIEHPIYNFPINYNLKPDAYLSVLANSPCPK